MIKLTLIMSVQSDYHIASGTGGGVLCDSLLMRDSAGNLTIRGTTLCGLLRDASCRLLTLPSLTAANSKNLLGRLFGSPSAAKTIRVSGASPVDEVLCPIKTDKGLKIEKICRRMSMDPTTRRCAENKLFAREETGQLKFQFTVTCENLADASFIAAAAKMLRGFGSSRRRGLGECLLHIVAAEGIDGQGIEVERNLLGQFKRFWLDNEPDEETKSTLVDFAEKQCVAVAPVQVRLAVLLKEPVLVSSRVATGNRFVTQNHIPGSAVRGALASKIAGFVFSDSTSPEYRLFVDLFRRGGTLFPMLYPALELSITRLADTLPTPLDIVACKYENPLRHDGSKHKEMSMTSLSKPLETLPECSVCGADLNHPSGFISLGGKKRELAEVPMLFEMHNKIDPETGRVGENSLYSYEVLAPGQWFSGTMTCMSEERFAALKKMIGIADDAKSCEIHIGRANRRGYGKAEMFFEIIHSEDDAKSKETTDAAVIEDAVVSLASDTIILDRWGRSVQCIADECGKIVEREINRTLCEAGLGDKQVVIEEIFQPHSRQTIVDGFYPHLGLPRCRDLALSAGSTVRVKFAAPGLSQSAVACLEQFGIGLRRNEGFGRLQINSPAYAESKRERKEWTVPTRKHEQSVVSKQHHRKEFIRAAESYLNNSKVFDWQKAIDSEKAKTAARGAAGMLQGMQTMPMPEVWEQIIAWKKAWDIRLPDELGTLKHRASNERKTSCNDPQKCGKLYEYIVEAVKVFQNTKYETRFWREAHLSDSEKAKLYLSILVRILNVYAKQNGFGGERE